MLVGCVFNPDVSHFCNAGAFAYYGLNYRHQLARFGLAQYLQRVKDIERDVLAAEHIAQVGIAVR